jgi:hypothetical protein
MGDVLEFKRPPKKLSGFMPADLGKVPAVLSHPVAQANTILWASTAIWLSAIAAITALWLRQ